MGEPALDTGPVALVEVVGPEVLVLSPARQQVVGNHQDRMRDGDRGLLLAAPCGDAAELGRQVRIAFPRGSVRGLDQDAPQGAVAFAGPATAPLPGALVLAGRQTRPGGQLAGAGEAGPVGPDLGQQRLGSGAAHAGDSVQPPHLVDHRGQPGVDLGAHLLDERLQPSRCASLCRNAPLARSANAAGASSPASSAWRMARAEAPVTSLTTAPSWKFAPSSVVCSRLIDLG